MCVIHPNVCGSTESMRNPAFYSRLRVHVASHHTSFTVSDIKGLPIIKVLDLKFSPVCCLSLKQWPVKPQCIIRLCYDLAEVLLCCWKAINSFSVKSETWLICEPFPRTCPGGLHAAPHTWSETYSGGCRLREQQCCCISALADRKQEYCWGI